MTLTQNAYLEFPQSGTNATFELGIGLNYQSQLQKSYVMGSRGQYIREVVNQTFGQGTISEERRTGYWLDGGAGDWSPSLQFRTGIDDVVWGDQSGGMGPSNVTETDASGQGVKAISRLQVLQYWIATSRSDSLEPVKLHHGEWTDGSIAHISGVSAGAFNQPMTVAITDTNFTGVEPRGDDTVSFEGTIELSHVAVMTDGTIPDWIEGIPDALNDAASDIPL